MPAFLKVEKLGDYSHCVIFSSIYASSYLQVEEKFDQIHLLLESKPYSRHIVTQYYAIENNLENSQDEEVEFFILLDFSTFL